jgi:hypothetical protein
MESNQHLQAVSSLNNLQSPIVQYVAIEVNRSKSFEERVELYEEICAELIETKRKLEVMDENFKAIEMDNTGAVFYVLFTKLTTMFN